MFNIKVLAVPFIEKCKLTPKVYFLQLGGMDGVNDDRFYANKFDAFKGETMIGIDGRVREIDLHNFCVEKQNILFLKHFEHTTFSSQNIRP